ncbi:gustatory receptor for sugar taste 64f-like [Colias croceus]|uniref:gustatory receptor for sugar taste 64f-like n=1 Tax=Colias crocea TaxID=72248 RepID=UPI001E281086|nr:gustatory receptor for sugar taste 64f-like [Colias croceus]
MRNLLGLHSTMRSTFFIGRVMCLLPIIGLNFPVSKYLRFTLRTPYTIIYFISLFGQLLMFSTSFHWLVHNGISLATITNALFYSASLVSSLVLANMSRSWPKLVRQVELIETKLPLLTPDVASLSNIVMVFMLFAALVEHVLSILYCLTVASNCNPNNILETFFQHNMPWIFDYTSYSLWKGILVEVFNIQSTFLWSFSDLLIMVISIYLTEHFVVHNYSLKKAINEKSFPCVEFRKQYCLIVRLVKLINDHIGIFILTSFGSNLYWICIQFFNNLNKTQTGHFLSCPTEQQGKTLTSIVHTTYFTYSFSFLVVRTFSALLLAARVHSKSRIPLLMLYNVPSARYNVEIERFIYQVKNLKVALSGLGFFYVTKTMILSLIGTIITYELVLLQFDSE